MGSTLSRAWKSTSPRRKTLRKHQHLMTLQPSSTHFVWFSLLLTFGDTHEVSLLTCIIESLLQFLPCLDFRGTAKLPVKAHGSMIASTAHDHIVFGVCQTIWQLSFSCQCFQTWQTILWGLKFWMLMVASFFPAQKLYNLAPAKFGWVRAARRVAKQFDAMEFGFVVLSLQHQPLN